ncbi:MAG: hypothetical protein EOP39_13915, partial [Rubrivivax sp.]
TITAGGIDAANRNVSVTASNSDASATAADTTNATVDNIAPTVTDGRISISGGSGTGGAYKIGDTVTATWNNTAGGDNNSDTISSATVNFSAFGGGTAVAATNSSGTWTATYTLAAGSIDLANRNVSVTATDNAGNTTTTTDSTNAVVDSVAPTVTNGRINISGGSGTGGAYKIGDTVTATWNNTVGGDANSDTISSVTVDFSAFGGGSAVSATNSSGTWTATYTLVAGVIDATNRNVSVTARDNAGNTTTTADSTNATVDNQAPAAPPAPSMSSASDTGASASDGITSNATPTFTGTAPANTAVMLYDTDGTTVLGSTTSDGSGNWTITAATLAAGAHTVTARTADAVGNLSSASAGLAIVIDATAPAAPSAPDLASGSDSGTSSTDNITSTTSPTFTGTAEAGSTVTLYDTDGTTVLGSATATGGAWSITSSALAAGSHTLTAKATDAAGNVSSTSSGLSATIDTTSPTALALDTTTVPASAATSGNGIATLSATDSLGITYALAAGNGINDADNGSFSISGNALHVGASTLTAGTYKLYLSATDVAGNVAHQAFTLTVVDAPAVSAIVRGGGAVATVNTAATSVTYTVTFDQAVTGVDASDFALTATGSASGTIASVTGSGTTYTVTVNTLSGDGTLRLDLNGSGTGIQSGASVAIAGGYTAGASYILDHTAPAAPSTPDLAAGSDTGSSSTDNNTSDTTPTFTGTAESGSTVTLYDTDGSTVLGSATATGGSWSITSSALAAGSHTVTVKAADAAGNVSSASSALIATVDTAAPMALALNTTTVATSAAAAGNGIATVSASDGFGITYALAAGNGTNDAHNGSFNLSGTSLNVGASPLSAGTYHLYVSATDAAGNVAYQAFTLTVADAPSVSAIVRDSAAAVSTAASSVTYTVTFDQAVTGVDASDFALTATGTASGSIASVAGSGTTYTVTVDTLSGDGALRLDLNGSGTGIQSGASVAIAGGYTAGQAYTLDHTAPAAPSTPDLAAASDTGSSSTDNITSAATPTFTGTAESGSTVTLYDTDGTTVLGSTTATGGAWSITASTLAAGGHTFTAMAVDAAGNVSSASSALTVTVDTAAPTALALNTTYIAASAATAGAGIATLSATDGLGITYALAAGNGTNDADNGSFNLSGTSLNVGGSPLSAGTYHLYVSATDAAGNVAYQALTLTVADAPSVSAIVRSGGAAAAVAAATSSLSYTVTFDQAVTGVDASDFTLNSTGTASGVVASVTGSGTTYTVTVNALSGDGTLRLDLNGSGTGIQSGTSVAVGGGYAAGEAYSVDRVAPATPSRPALTAGTDTGVSASDGITRLAAPTFTGTAQAGSTVTLYDTDGTTALGSATAIGGSWSITTSALAEGIHTVSAKASDSAGNVSAASVGQTVILDTSAPTAVGLGTAVVSSDLAASGAVLTTLSATDGLAITFALATGNGTNDADNARFSIAGNKLTVGGSALAAGTYHVYVAATDVAGNATSQALTLTVIDIPRATGIVRADGATVPAGSGTLHYTVTFDQPVTGVDTGDFSLATTGTASGHIASVTGSGTTYIVSVDALGGDGTLRLDLNASGTGIQSGAGAMISAGFTAGEAYTVDRVAPAAPSRPMLAAESDTGFSTSDGITQRNTPTFTGTADAGSTVTLVDSDGAIVLGSTTAAAGGTWSITTSALTAGSHTVSARASDAAGNVSAASSGLTVSIDATAPVITQIPAPPVRAYKAGDVLTFTVGTSEAVHVTGTPQLLLAVGGGTRTAAYVSGSGTTALVFSYTVQAGDNGALAFNALESNGSTLTDAAGNALDLTLHDVGDLTGRVLDTVAPATTFSGLALSADSGSSPSDFITNVATQTLTAQLSAVPAAGERVYGSVDGGATWVDITARLSGTTLTWSGITLAGSNSLQLKVSDAAGNDGAVASQAYLLDTTAPTTPSVNAASTIEERPTLSGTAALAAGETLTAAVGGATYAVTPSAGQWTLDLATATPLTGSLSLAPGQSHDVTATARDAAGNTSVASSTLSVLQVPPPEVPVVAQPIPASTPIFVPAEVTPLPALTPITFLTPASPIASLLSPVTPLNPVDSARPALDSSSLLRATQSTPAANAGFQVIVRTAPAGDSGGSALFVNTPLPDLALNPAGGRLEYVIPADAFAHRSEAVVQLSALQANGAPLPAWVRFDPKTGKFTMEPPRGFTGEFAVRVIARDAQGNEAVQVFKIRVGTDRSGRSSLSEQLKGSTQAQHLAALQRLARTTAQPWSKG